MESAGDFGEQSWKKSELVEDGAMNILMHNIQSLGAEIEALHQRIRPVLREPDPSDALSAAKETHRSTLYDASQNIADLRMRLAEINRRIDI